MILCSNYATLLLTNFISHEYMQIGLCIGKELIFLNVLIIRELIKYSIK